MARPRIRPHKSAAFHQHLSRRPALLDRIMADHDGIAAAPAPPTPTGPGNDGGRHLDYVQREMLAVWD